MPGLNAAQRERPGSLDAQFAAALRPVLVQPSLLMEIGWVLWSLERAHRLDDRSPLGPASGAPSRLIGRAGRFWNDGVAGFTEIGILADRAGVLFEPQLDRIISALSKVEIEDGSIGLSSERPDERVALALRMKRISSDATCRAEYLALVAEVGSWVAVGMEEQGNRLVAQECARVRQALERGLPLNAVVRPEAASCLGLEPLVTAALASGQLIVSPCFYAGAGHVLDLGATVSFGYGVAEIATRSAMLTRGGQIALKAQLLADPARARMLTCLLEIPAAQQAMSAGEFARKCEVKNGEVRKHLRILCRAGLIEAIHVGQKVQYRVKL